MQGPRERKDCGIFCQKNGVRPLLEQNMLDISRSWLSGSSSVYLSGIPQQRVRPLVGFNFVGRHLITVNAERVVVGTKAPPRLATTLKQCTRHCPRLHLRTPMTTLALLLSKDTAKVHFSHRRARRPFKPHKVMSQLNHPFGHHRCHPFHAMTTLAPLKRPARTRTNCSAIAAGGVHCSRDNQHPWSRQWPWPRQGSRSRPTHTRSCLSCEAKARMTAKTTNPTRNLLQRVSSNKSVLLCSISFLNNLLLSRHGHGTT